MSTFIDHFISAMKNGGADFFKQLGQRITCLRKERGLTQAQLAEMVNVKQQVIASYEVGRRRVPVSLISPLATTLGVSVEDLLGIESAAAKRGPTPKLQQQVEQINRLPRSKQRFVSELLKTVLHQAA